MLKLDTTDIYTTRSVLYPTFYKKKRKLKMVTHFNLYLDTQILEQYVLSCSQSIQISVCLKSDVVPLYTLTEWVMSYK